MSKPQNQPKQNTTPSSAQPAPAAPVSLRTPSTTATEDTDGAKQDGSGSAGSLSQSGEASITPSKQPLQVSPERAAKLEEIAKRQEAEQQEKEAAKRPEQLRVVGRAVSLSDCPSLGGKELVIHMRGDVTGSFKLLVPYRALERGLGFELGETVEIEVKPR